MPEARKRAKRKPSHGGARPGAGRKPRTTGVVRVVTSHLDLEHDGLLTALELLWGGSTSEVVARCILETAAREGAVAALGSGSGKAVVA